MMSAARILLSAVLLGGGAATVGGNHLGGTKRWFDLTAANARRLADAQCRKFGKSAHITNIVAEGGGHVIFECK